MSVITPASAAAKRHYDRFCGDGRPSLPVPEWSDEEGAPLIVYWRPFTLQDHLKVFGQDRPEALAWAEVVARKAEDREGRKLFPEPDDLNVLRTQADHAVVRRLAERIVQSPSIEEMVAVLEKNALRLAMHRVADRLRKTIGEIETMTVAEFNETLAFHDIRSREDS